MQDLHPSQGLQLQSSQITINISCQANIACQMQHQAKTEERPDRSHLHVVMQPGSCARLVPFVRQFTVTTIVANVCGQLHVHNQGGMPLLMLSVADLEFHLTDVPPNRTDVHPNRTRAMSHELKAKATSAT